MPKLVLLDNADNRDITRINRKEWKQYLVIIADMMVPKKLPGLQLATIVLAIYALIWISLEGKLLQVLILALGVSIVASAQIFQRTVGGRRMSLAPWLALTATVGLLIGASLGLFTLALMSLKTGLHAHGPEFTIEEFNWVIDQIPVWGAAGLLAGLGLGFLIAEFTRAR